MSARTRGLRIIAATGVYLGVVIIALVVRPYVIGTVLFAGLAVILFALLRWTRRDLSHSIHESRRLLAANDYLQARNVELATRNKLLARENERVLLRELNLIADPPPAGLLQRIYDLPTAAGPDDLSPGKDES